MNRIVQVAVSFVLFFMITAESVYPQDIHQILSKRLEEYKENAPSERVFLIHDRDIYAPGDIIWLSALVYDISKTHLSGQSEKVKVVISNSEGMEIFMKELKVLDGKSNGYIQIPNGIDEGVFYLSGSTIKSDNISPYSNRFIIREKIVPPFIIEVEFPDKYYKSGDEVLLNVSFKDFYNEPKKNIEYELSLYDGKKRVRIYSGKIKKGGQIAQIIKIPNDIKSGMLSYKIVADCKENIAEQEGIIPVITENVYVEFYPSSGRIIDGFDNTIYFYAYDAIGQPLKIRGSLIANEERLTSVETDTYGIGSFIINPSSSKEYKLIIDEPVPLERTFDLPENRPNGAIINVTKSNTDILEVSIKSNFINPKPAFLVGVSGNEIFWISEHSLKDESVVNIDLKPSANEIGHFILINQKAEIEAEYITQIKAIPSAVLNPKINIDNPTSKSKVEVELKNQSREGSYIFASVNEAWMTDQLANPNLFLLNLPYDIRLSSIFQQSRFVQSISEPSILESYLKYYVPYGFGWDRILNTDGALKMGEAPSGLSENRGQYYEILAGNRHSYESKKILHSNITCSIDFLTGNPSYFSDLHKRAREEKVPAYKALLQNGTPLLDIIQTIKPYNLQGDKIVFLGGSNSLIAQDGALIVLDGIQRGTSASVLQGINPWDVDKINVSTNPMDIQRYTGLNSVGLIEITLKKGEDMEEFVDEQLPEDLDYETTQENARKEGGDDYRSTLMWDVKNEASSYQKQYQHSEFISPVQMRMYFIPDKGSPSYYETEYELK